MAYWKNKDKKTKQLIRPSTKKKPMVRVKKHRNLTDKEAKREKTGKRVKNYVNTTDAAKRASHHRKPRGSSTKLPSIGKMLKGK